MLKFFLAPGAKEKGVEFKAPRRMDAGFDVPCVYDVEIPPKDFTLIQTGVHLAIPEGWVGILRDRSSVALKGGACTAGVIDASYRGEVKVAMHNLGDEPIVFKAGDRVAQCVIVPHLTAEGLSLIHI